MSFGVLASLISVGGVGLGLLVDTATAPGASACAAVIGMFALVPRARRLRCLCGWLTCAAVAVAYGAHARDVQLSGPPDWLLTGHGGAETVLVEGRLRRDAWLDPSGIRMALDLTAARQNRQWVPLRETVLVSVKGELALGQYDTWTAGRAVRMPAQLRLPPLTRNPGSPSVRWQRLTRPYQLLASVKSGVLVEVVRLARPWDEAAARVRQYVRGVAARDLAPLGEQTRAVVTAILIGDRAGLNDDVVRRLQMAGTFHVVAISGGNVAILTALCFLTLRLLTRGEVLPTSTTLVLVVAYGCVVGAEPSVTRAVWAAVIYLSLRLTALVPTAVNVVAITAVVCTMWDPRVVLNVGAWLSFGATLGLLMILPRLPGGTTQGRGRLWSLIQGVFLATLAAEIVVMPIAASVFTRVGVGGLVLNFIAIPAMTVVQVAGLLLCVVNPWWPGAAAMLARVAHGGTAALVGSASAVELAPWLSWRVPSSPLICVVAYFAAVLVAVGWRGRRVVGHGATVLALVCGVMIAVAPWSIVRKPAPGWLRLTMLDVGQGEALALQFPDGRQALIDAGGSPGTFDVGGRVVVPAVMALGIRRPDWLVITHGDSDHVGGALRVVEDLGATEIWEGVPVPPEPPLLALRRLAHAQGLVWRRVIAGDQVEIGAVELDILHPPVPEWERRRVRNDDSVVIRVRFGAVELLLTGDAGGEFESTYRPRDGHGWGESPRPPIRILKVGHHGSRTSTSQAFLDAYAPSVALVSAGKDNVFGHPSPTVVRRLARANVSVFRTDDDGAVILDTDGRQVRLRTMSGRTLTVVAR